LNYTQIGLILLAGFALGSNVVMIRLGMEKADLPPMLLVSLRFAITTLAFATTLITLRRKVPRSPRVWFDLIIAGIGNTAIPVIAFTYALAYISSGVLGILMALYPMLTAVLAHFAFEDERLSPRRLSGLALGLSGALILVLTGTTGLEVGGDLRGYLLASVGIILGSVSVIYMKRRLSDEDSIVVTAGQVLFSLPLVIVLALIAPDVPVTSPLYEAAMPLNVITATGWLVIIYTALVGSYLGYLILFVLIKRYGATSGALPGYVIPVVAGLMGAVLLGEIINPPLVLGAALVLMGVFLVSV
jgi:drug/metabolite transporter (DMT)-like permease